ncbi:MAG: type II 3-dehydroquinate dehydratase [bacterium]|nr:type II 3-dehydroquinate dehydratase [bacterium]
MKPTIWVIQGPNLNLLGEREPQLYGTKTLNELETELNLHAEQLGYSLQHFQSNHEGSLIDKLQEIRKSAVGALLNGGGYTHSSIALADTVKAIQIPVVEVHLTDTGKREFFRKQSYLSNVAIATFQGEGFQSYHKALDFLVKYIQGEVERVLPFHQSFTVEELIWLDDTDAAGILFNAHLFRICHRVYEKWMNHIGFPIGKLLEQRNWGIPIARLEGDFIRPLRTGMKIFVSLQLIRLGERSFTLGYRLYDELQVLYATASSTHVATDALGGKADFPKEFIDALKHFFSSC